MTKKTDEEFGVLITREIRSMMLDSSISYEDRAMMFCSIVGDEKIKNKMMSAFASSLKVGYIAINEKRNAEIHSRRERQKMYQRDLRASTEINIDKRSSTRIYRDRRASLNKVELSKVDNIPLNPPEGVEGEIPPEVSPDELMEKGRGKKKAKIVTRELDDVLMREVRYDAEELAEHIEFRTKEWGHMLVNRGRLMKCLISVLKKNSGGEMSNTELKVEIKASLERWAEAWAAEEWRYAPGRITEWLYDEKWREEPRKPKKKPEVEDCVGEVGVTII